MNLLFEIADKDIMLILTILFGILLIIFIIFYVIGRNDKNEVISEEKEPELFENIKPTTEEGNAAKDELEKVFRRMSEDLQKNPGPKVIEKFEKEQEENAVISYQELIKQAEEKRNHPNIEIQKSDIQKKEEKRFQNSDIISPIFGIQKQTSKVYDNKEQKTPYNEDSNIEFLNSLKNLRKNL